MEFLRFGSSIPGAYWGCCAVCIAQDFNCSPDEKASIELVCGGGGQPIGGKFLGMTNREIFEARLRIGTFSDSDMPNHGFLAVITQSQINSENGRNWLYLLKKNGFEFIRTIENSVYSGSSLFDENDSGNYTGGYCNGDGPCDDCDCEDCFDDVEMNLNYLFGLFRNIGVAQVYDPFQPPVQWLNIEGGAKEPSQFLSQTERQEILASQRAVHLEAWNNNGPVKFYKKKDLVDAGVPVVLAGQRSKRPQQLESARILCEKQEAEASLTAKAPFSSGNSEVTALV